MILPSLRLLHLYGMVPSFSCRIDECVASRLPIRSVLATDSEAEGTSSPNTTRTFWVDVKAGLEKDDTSETSSPSYQNLMLIQVKLEKERSLPRNPEDYRLQSVY